MLAAVRDRARDQDGAPLVLGLAFVGLLIIPMIVILLQTSVLSVTSVQAEGAAYNIAYGTLNRSIDADSVRYTGTVQLYQRRDYEDCSSGKPVATSTCDQYTAAEQRLTQTTQNNSFLRAMGVSYSFDELSTAGTRWTTDSSNDAPAQVPVGLVSMDADGELARALATAQQNGATGCGAEAVRLESNGSLLCWKDLRAGRYGLGETEQNNRFRGGWDQFTPGAETSVNYNFTFLGRQFTGRRIGVAIVAQPCETRVGATATEFETCDF